MCTKVESNTKYQRQKSHILTEKNPLTLIASPQTHKQFICHTHIQREKKTERRIQL